MACNLSNAFKSEKNEYENGTNKSDNEIAAMEKIFSACDPNETGYANVLALINFMTPYMQQNLSDLRVLKIKLDPIDVNPRIDKNKFFTVMQEWENQLSSSSSDQNTISNSSPIKSENEDAIDYQSALSGFQDLHDLNSSNITSYSCGSTSPLDTSKNSEKIFELQIEVQKLRTNNNKLKAHNDDLQAQLLSYEESNANLQADNLRLKKRLSCEQQINDELQRFRKDCSELSEINQQHIQENEKLQLLYTTLKNENSKLLDKEVKFDEEKLYLLEKISQLEECNTKIVKKNAELQSKIGELRDELNDKSIIIRDFESKIIQSEEEINDSNSRIQFLQHKVKQMENVTRRLQKQINEAIINKTINNTHRQRNTTPFTFTNGVGRRLPNVTFDSSVLNARSPGPSDDASSFPIGVPLHTELKNDQTVDDHILCSNQIKQLESQLSILEKEHIAQLETVKCQEATIKEYINQSQEMEQLIRKLNEDVKKHQKEFDNQIQSVRNLETMLAERDAEVAQLRSQMHEQFISAASTIQFKNVIERNKQLETELNSVHEVYQQQISELKAHVNCLKASMDKTDNVHQHLKQLFDDNTKLIENSSQFENIVEELNNKILFYKNLCEQQDREIQKLKSQPISNTVNCTKNNEILTLKVQLKTRDTTIQQQAEQLKQAQSEIEHAEKNLCEIKTLRIELNRLKSIEYEHNTTCQHLNEQLERVISELNFKKEIIKTNEPTIQKYKNDHAQLQQLLVENQRLSSEYESMYAKLSCELVQERQKLQSNLVEFDNIKREYCHQKELLHSSELSVQSIRKKHIELEQKIHALKLENNSLREYQNAIKMSSLDMLTNIDEMQILNSRLKECLSCTQMMETFTQESTDQRQLCSICKTKNTQQQSHEQKTEDHSSRPTINVRSSTIVAKSDRLRKQWSKKKLDKLENELDLKKEELLKYEADKFDLELKLEESNKERKHLDDEIKKIKNYFEETTNHLYNIFRKTKNDLKRNNLLPTDWEDESAQIGGELMINKRYFETFYMKFNKVLYQCIYIIQLSSELQRKNVMKTDLRSRILPKQSNSTENIISQQNHPIKLQPAKLLLSTVKSSSYQCHSAPPSPKPRSKFVVLHSPNNHCTTATTTSRCKVQRQKAIADDRNMVPPPIALKKIRTLREPSQSSQFDITTLGDDKISLESNFLEPTQLSNNPDDENNSSREQGTIVNSEQVEKSLESEPSVNVADLLVETNINRRFSELSISDVSSTNSGSTESLSIDNEHTLTDNARINLQTALNALINGRNSKSINGSSIDGSLGGGGDAIESSPADSEKNSIPERSRSQSFQDAEEVEIFPNMTDSFLNNLNLQSTVNEETKKENSCEQDELERKFSALSLAFNIDADTLQIRNERLKHYRDQAEKNFMYEIKELRLAVNKLNRFCLDAERTELVTNILAQIDILVKAAHYTSSSAQCFGAVNQEVRLNDSVQMMLKYIENIKTQRDTARKHFQYTRRMLQESTTTITKSPSTKNSLTLNGNIIINSNTSSSPNRLITRRRASIAAISRPSPSSSNNTNSLEHLRLLANRKPLSPLTHHTHVNHNYLHSTINEFNATRSRLELLSTSKRSNNSRLNRSDLNADNLQNIHENREDESFSNSNTSNTENSDEEEIIRTERLKSGRNSLQNSNRSQITNISRNLALNICNFCRHYFGDRVHNEGLLYEICVLGALMCFTYAICNLSNILLHLEFARRGTPIIHIPWRWATWEEILNLFI